MNETTTKLLKAIEDLAGTDARLVGLVFEYDGYEMHLSPGDESDGPAWIATAERVESLDGEPETAIGEGATPIAALDDCSQMDHRIEAGEDEEESNE